MTHTVAIEAEGINGDQRYFQAKVTISSYTAGGEDLSDLTNRLSKLDWMIVQPVTGATAVIATVVRSTSVVKLWTATQTQLTTGYPMTLDVMILGR